jgi:hypothetical protein
MEVGGTPARSRPPLLRLGEAKHPLCDMLCQFRAPLTIALRRSDHLHLLPVVGKFFAAIQTGNVGAGQNGGLRTRPSPANSDWETVPRVSAAEEHIHQFSEHDHLPHSSWEARTPGLNLGLTIRPVLERAINKYLDSLIDKTVYVS